MTGPRATGCATEALRHALASPFVDDEIRLVTLAAARVEPERLLRLESDGPAVFWGPAEGVAMAGVGGAVVVRGAGARRAAEVGEAAERLWPRIRSVAGDESIPITPRLFGGLAFLPDRSAPPWEDFGQAAFVLPRLLYETDDDGGRLAVAVTADELRRDGPDAALRLVRSALALLGDPTGGYDDADGAGPTGAAGRASPAAAPGSAASGRPTGGAADAGSGSQWVRIVESIQRLIATGRAEKIVAARVHELPLPRPLDLAAALGRLETGASEARFAFRFGRTVFLGATPERLIARRGLDIHTEAVAGSIDADGPDGADRAAELRASLKDDEEHRFVVRAIAGVLAPLCDRLEYPSEPDIKRLRHVLHLRTPFEGTLARPVPILDLVTRLHPTPAVGGTPTAAALDWIAREEPGCRGWYAGPVGWFDAAGDGDFVVALRSALVAGDRALLYAGAGIVRDSDVEAERAETDVKLRTMLDILAVDG